MKSQLDIEGQPRDPKEKLSDDLAHPDPPRNTVKPCESKEGCLHLHGHEGRCRTTDECLCDLEGVWCDIHKHRSVPHVPREPAKHDMVLPDHLLKEI